MDVYFSIHGITDDMSFKCAVCGGSPSPFISYTPHAHAEDLMVFPKGKVMTVCLPCLRDMEIQWIDRATTEQLLLAVNHQWSSGVEVERYYRDRLSGGSPVHEDPAIRSLEGVHADQVIKR